MNTRVSLRRVSLPFPRGKGSGVRSFFLFAAIIALLPIARVHAADIGAIVNNQPVDNFNLIGVNDLAKLLSNPASHVHLYDADSPDTRAHAGMIPGARPLTSDDKYNVADELPSNKNAKLVFYCHDQL
jgi:hypothetical protein